MRIFRGRNRCGSADGALRRVYQQAAAERASAAGCAEGNGSALDHPGRGYPGVEGVGEDTGGACVGGRRERGGGIMSATDHPDPGDVTLIV